MSTQLEVSFQQKIEWSMQDIFLKDISILRIGIVFDSAMKYIFDEAHRISFKLYKNLENNILSTVFGKAIYRSQKIRNTFIARLQSDTTSSQTLFSTVYQVIPMAKYHFKYTSTRYWNLLCFGIQPHFDVNVVLKTIHYCTNAIYSNCHHLTLDYYLSYSYLAIA